MQTIGVLRKARRIRGLLAWRSSPGEGPPSASEQNEQDMWEALGELCELLDGSAVPNGVIELVMEAPGAAARRQLLDVHGGQITRIEPGSTVPWACVSGTLAAWARALGSDGDVTQLKRAGEPRLADGLLTELRRRAPARVFSS